MNYLLDTNIISEFRKPRPHLNVITWLNQVNADAVYLSVITIGELQKGITRLADLDRRQSLQAWLEEDLLVRFATRVVPLDLEVLLVWGNLAAHLEQTGKTMPAIDSLIAATALHGRFILVTRNEQDFAAVDIPIVNPWTWSPTP
jgi:predicted nucleic acid-binding protein